MSKKEINTFGNNPEIMRDYKSPAQIFHEEEQFLSASLKAKAPVLATFVRIAPYEDAVWLIFSYGKSRINIWVKDEDFFLEDLKKPLYIYKNEKQDLVSARKWVDYQAKLRLGGKFELMLIGSDGSDDTLRYQASRVEAMKFNREDTFKNTYEGKGIPKVGDHIYGRVVFSQKRSIFLEACGVEVQVPRVDVAWVWPGDCRRDYVPGLVVKSVITELTIDETEDDCKVNMKLSPKLVEPRNFKADKYEEGNIVRAEVINFIKKNDEVTGFICCVDREATIYVPLNDNFTPPMEGDDVIVQIRHQNEQEDGSVDLLGQLKAKVVYGARK